MSRTLYLLVFILPMLVLLGCSVMPAGMAPAADDLANQEYEVLGKASGSASHFSLFFFLPLGKADIDAAVRQAIAQRDGDNLINVRYWQRASWALIGAVITIEVEGDVIKYKR